MGESDKTEEESDKTEDKSGKRGKGERKVEDVCKKCEKSDDVDACKTQCETCLANVDKDAELKIQFEEMVKCMEGFFEKEKKEHSVEDVCKKCEKSDDVDACK